MITIHEPVGCSEAASGPDVKSLSAIESFCTCTLLYRSISWEKRKAKFGAEEDQKHLLSGTADVD